MEIGLSTATFFMRAYTENAFELIRSMDVKLCEVFMATFSEYEPQFGEVLLEKKGDLKVHSIHTLNSQFEPQLFNRSERTKSDAFRVFEKTVDNGAKIGAKSYTFHGSARLKPKQEYNFNFERLGAVLEELSVCSKAKGIEIAFENVYWAMFNAPAFFEELKKYSPSVRACLDIKQAERSEISPYKYLSAMGDRLQTVHLSDFDASGNTCAPGKGIFDFERLVKTLLDKGHKDVPLIVELYENDYDDLDDLKRSIDFLKNILAKAV